MRKLFCIAIGLWCVVVLARLAERNQVSNHQGQKSEVRSQESERENLTTPEPDNSPTQVRPKNSRSVKVKGPSRGLVTRLPAELADQMKEGDKNRTATRAENVRFEDGTAGNARGHKRVSQTSALLTGLVAHWRLDEGTGSRVDVVGGLDLTPFEATGNEGSGVIGIPGKFGNCVRVRNANNFLYGALRFSLSDATAIDFNGSSSFTVCGWYRLTSDDGQYVRLLGKGGTSGNGSWDYTTAFEPLTDTETEWEMAVSANGCEFHINSPAHALTSASIGAGGPYTLGQWHFFALIYEAGVGFRVRTDGYTSATTAQTAGILTQNYSVFALGGASADGSSNDDIDSVSVWNRLLSTAELNAIQQSELDYPFAGGCANLQYQGNVIQNEPYPLFFGIGKYLYLAGRTYAADPPAFGLAFTTLYTMPSGLSDEEDRWSACDFYDKVIFAQKDTPPQLYTTGSATRALPGLVDGSAYAGVTAFQQHLLLWKDTTLKWSDLNDVTNWIPVAETIASLRLTVDSSFLQPTAGSTVQVFVQEPPTGITVGQYVRATVGLTENFYTVTAPTPVVELAPITIASTVSQVIAASATTPIFLTASAAWEAGQLVSVTGNTSRLTVAAASAYPTSAFPVKTAATTSATNPRTVTVVLAGQLTDFAPLDYVSLGPSSVPGVDLWRVNAAGVTQSGGDTQLALTQVTVSGAGSSGLGSAPTGNTATIAIGTNVVHQPYVSLTKADAGTITVTASNNLIEEYGITLKLEALTGRLPGGTQAPTGLTRASNVVTVTLAAAHGYQVGDTVTVAGVTASSFNGTFTVATVPTTLTFTYAQTAANASSTVHGTVQGTIPAASTITTLDANEAGETLVVGASDNGAIYQVVPLGDYAYIFKNRCIQSVQYVGRLSGTFFIHTEVRDEGLIGRNAITRLSESRAVFLGNRELYDYRGGNQIIQVCQQYTRQLFEELDRGRIHEVILHHKELRNEVWVIYPTQGGSKVLVWNYLEDTATLDLYDNDLSGLCSVGQMRWSTDPTWLDFGDQTWEQLADTLTWDSLTGTGEELVTLLATGTGDVFAHGSGFNRDGEAYTSIYETMAYDFGDPDVWKYVQTVVVQLQVKTPDVVNRKLYLQVGTQANADGTVTWGAAQTLYVQGDGQEPTKVNPGGAGRFVRLRFYSEDVDVEWRVSGFEIYVRAGGTC